MFDVISSKSIKILTISCIILYFICDFISDQRDELLHLLRILVVSTDDPHHLEAVHQRRSSLLDYVETLRF